MRRPTASPPAHLLKPSAMQTMLSRQPGPSSDSRCCPPAPRRRVQLPAGQRVGRPAALLLCGAPGGRRRRHRQRVPRPRPERHCRVPGQPGDAGSRLCHPLLRLRGPAGRVQCSWGRCPGWMARGHADQAVPAGGAWGAKACACTASCASWTAPCPFASGVHGLHDRAWSSLPLARPGRARTAPLPPTPSALWPASTLAGRPCSGGPHRAAALVWAHGGKRGRPAVRGHQCERPGVLSAGGGRRFYFALQNAASPTGVRPLLLPAG